MAKTNIVTVDQGGAKITMEEKRSGFYRVFGRVSGVILILCGVSLLFVSPVGGIVFIGIGFLLFKKLGNLKTSKILSISTPRYTGGPTFGEWNEKVHHGAAQTDRFERAAHETMDLLSYNDETGAGMVRSSSGKTYVTSLDYCSCPDFDKRSRPCKHIYFLAMKMGYTSNDFYGN